MTQTILNRVANDPMKQPLFLGDDLSIQRYDVFKYPVFFDLYKKQLEFFWRPEEIELKKDRSDFKDDKTMSELDKNILNNEIGGKS